MSAIYSKNLTPKITKRVHPFYIDIVNRNNKKYAAVNYHSRLFTRLEIENNYMIHKIQTITGLDFEKEIPGSFPGKNFYCVLKIKIDSLRISNENKAATIEWVEGDQSETLKPVIFDSNDNARQTEARIIIGVLVNDGEATAGTLSPDLGGARTNYIIQFVSTDLIMTNMVVDGIPIVYPVPFIGGGLNLESL